MRIFPVALLAPLVFVLLSGCLPDRPGITATPVGGQCRAAPVFEAPPLNPCAGTERVKITIVGDVLLHWQLQQLGYKSGFRQVWKQAEPYLARADIAIANLEGPVAPGLTRAGKPMRDPGPVYGTDVYTGYPVFNYHPVILRDLKAAGIDLMTTANNHAMDRGPDGADSTLAQLRKAGIGAVGSIRAGTARQFALHRKTALGTVSFIACSFSTNGMPDPKNQVLLCYENRRELLSLVRHESLDPAVAAVIVLPHWGQEYQSTPDAQQKALAQDLANAGATAIVGTHPHAVQPFATLDSPGGAKIPLVYSTGNFIAVQDVMPSKVGAIALLEMCKSTGGNKMVAERLGWIAMQIELTSRAYYLDIAPPGTPGARGLAFRHLSKIAPGFSARPGTCSTR
jgi:poly-gamma-glutamate synthesis protein (capsule biosynthesis protein)